ncbi:hypothetical protein K7X08_024609 [Anisodus acutangulus]|uniref:Uncharacterized protein n=1 Tax=Anisodus acutangulus TaxID=402998 RepID=A0A9Q1MBG4_9SOLA|nr:hypothetical protein K7X08_024609 [Anisodus acutangulus]
MLVDKCVTKSGCDFLLENSSLDSFANSSNNNCAFKIGPSYGSLFDDSYKFVSVKGGISGSVAELQDTADNHASTANDQRRVGITAPDGGGNKRPREAEDVNWDKRRKLKMMFYHVAKGIYLSQTKDPNYGKEDVDTQSD